jgi:hypothetical protein
MLSVADRPQVLHLCVWWFVVESIDDRVWSLELEDRGAAAAGGGVMKPGSGVCGVWRVALFPSKTQDLSPFRF